MKIRISSIIRVITILASASAVIARPNGLTLGVFLDIFSLFVVMDALNSKNRSIGIHVAACWLLILGELVRDRSVFSVYLINVDLVLDWLEVFPFPKLQSMGHELQAWPFREIVGKLLVTYGLLWLFAFSCDLLKYLRQKKLPGKFQQP